MKSGVKIISGKKILVLDPEEDGASLVAARVYALYQGDKTFSEDMHEWLDHLQLGS